MLRWLMGAHTNLCNFYKGIWSTTSQIRGMSKKLYAYSLLEYILEPVIYFLLCDISHLYLRYFKSPLNVGIECREGEHTREHLYCRAS